ncbi:lysylphosphatidylglycerol synthase transmembrane domain-containing protein [Chloroflexota bacterium]
MITDRNSKSLWKKIPRWMPGAVISLGLLAVILYFIDLDQVASSLIQADISYLLIALALAIIWLFIRGMVWWTLLKRRAGYGTTFLCMCEGYLLNNFLPFRLGEVGRAFLLSRKSDMRFMEIIPTIVIERVVDLMFSAGILIFSLPFILGVVGAEQIGFIVGAVMLAGLIGLFVLAYKRDWAGEFLDKLGLRWPAIQKIKARLIEPFLDGLSVLTDLRIFSTFIFWITLNWAVASAEYFLLVKAFFPDATFVWGTFSLGMAAFGGAIPSLPGAIGTLDSAVGGAVFLLSQNIDSAAAFVVVLRIFSYFITGIPALFALSSEGQTLSGLYKDITQFRNKTNVEVSE